MKYNHRDYIWKARRFLELVRGLDLLRTLEPAELDLDPKIYYRASPSGGRHLEKLLKSLSISNSNSVLDVGCGKGSALRSLSKFPFKVCDGIELSPLVASIAQKNFRSRFSSVRVFEGDVLDFERLHDYDHYYLYNPFSYELAKEFFSKISKSNRFIRVIYNNPEAESLPTEFGFHLKTVTPNHWGGMIYTYENHLS